MKNPTLKTINRIYKNTFLNAPFSFVFKEPEKGEKYIGAGGNIYYSGEGEKGTGNYRLVMKENN